MKCSGAAVILLLCVATLNVTNGRTAAEEPAKNKGNGLSAGSTQSGPMPTQYVFGTEKLTRYRLPTHCADLVVDRAQASCSEVFIVVIDPNHATPLHKHDDMEQIFYVLQGKDVLTIGDEKKQCPVKPGDVVRVPLRTYHSIRAEGDKEITYLCVDCFGSDRAKAEATWSEHIKAYYDQVGLDFNTVVVPNGGGSAAK